MLEKSRRRQASTMLVRRKEAKVCLAQNSTDELDARDKRGSWQMLEFSGPQRGEL